MNCRTTLKSILPLAALALSNCMSDQPSEAGGPATRESPVALRQQSQHMFNPAQYSLMSKGDFDGNGTKDLFYISSGGQVDLRLGNYSRTAPFAASQTVLLTGNFGNLTGGNYLVGHFNADNDADLFFIGNAGDIHVRVRGFKNGIKGYYDQHDLLPAGPNNWSTGKFIAGDINGDNLTDLYFLRNGGGLTVYVNYNGTLNEHYNYQDGGFGNWSLGKYYVGDFDGDRKSDLFWVSNEGAVYVRHAVNGYHLNPHRLLLNAGAFGTLTSGQYHLADIDGDNDADLLFVGTAGDVHARISSTTDYGAYRKLLNAGDFWRIDQGQYYVGDWDGNGQSDLFFIGNSGYVAVRLSNGYTLPTQLNMFNAGTFGNLDAGIYQ